METDPAAIPIPMFGPVCVRRQRRKRQKKLLVLLFLDFAKNTTLHGLRYITEAGLHIIEKVFWFFTFFASAFLCSYFIYEVWTKWQTSPVIVSFSAKHVSVDEVPFPSVTICPQGKFLQETFNFSGIWKLNDNGDNITNLDDIKTADVLSLICDVQKTIGDDSANLNASAIEKLHEISVDYDSVFLECTWRGEPCGRNFFNKVLTKNGICFNFNGLRADEILNEKTVQKEYNYIFTTQETKNWTIKRGYNTKSHQNIYPYRGRDNGGTPNLDLILANLDKQKDKRCNALYSGYKIYLHHPADLPQALLYHFAALPKQLTSMGIKFTMETARPDLKKYPVDIRQCYFQDDRPLTFFKQYTYNNCMLECLINFTYSECSCVAFYMPFNDSTKICSAGKSDCVSNAEAKFTEIEDADNEQCQCLPTCNSILYDAEIHKTGFHLGALFDTNYGEFMDFMSDNGKYNPESDTQSKVELFYKQPMFRTVHRSELYGLTDFLGNCGGLLGLFLGFSWLSLVEIFYFLTFRVYKTIKTDLRNEKADKSKEVLQIAAVCKND